MQAMASQLGGIVSASNKREFGHAQVEMVSPSKLLKNLGDGKGSANVWMSHGDKVSELPTGFICTGSSGSASIAAMELAEKNFYGVQFHPEVTHTDGGDRLLLTFTKDICGCAGDWTASNIVEDAIAKVREQVGTDKVLLGLSGGVDSSVVAALLSKAIGDQLTCIFVDNGLLRKGERDEVELAFQNAIGEGELTTKYYNRFSGR
jgi:GMP synthase (glutamine-hydrolysing)